MQELFKPPMMPGTSIAAISSHAESPLQLFTTDVTFENAQALSPVQLSLPPMNGIVARQQAVKPEHNILPPLRQSLPVKCPQALPPTQH
jgi:hypothetical protein